MDEYRRHFHKKIPRLDTLKFFLKNWDHLRAGLTTSQPLLAAAMKAQPFVGGGSKAGPWGLTIRPSAFTAADTKIAVQTRWNADVRFAPTREIHQHEGCVRFVPRRNIAASHRRISVCHSCARRRVPDAGLSCTDDRHFSAASNSRIVLCGAIISAPHRDG
jgi:hypothetical protein